MQSMDYSNHGNGVSTGKDKIHVKSRNSRETPVQHGFAQENPHLDKSIQSNFSQPPMATLTFENQGPQHPFTSQQQEMPLNPTMRSDFSGQLQTPHLRSRNSSTAEGSNSYNRKAHAQYFQHERKALEEQLSQTQRQLTSMQTS